MDGMDFFLATYVWTHMYEDESIAASHVDHAYVPASRAGLGHKNFRTSQLSSATLHRPTTIIKPEACGVTLLPRGLGAVLEGRTSIGACPGGLPPLLPGGSGALRILILS